MIIKNNIVFCDYEIAFTDNLKIDDELFNELDHYRYQWHRLDGPAKISYKTGVPYQLGYYINNRYYLEYEFFIKVAK